MLSEVEFKCSINEKLPNHTAVQRDWNTVKYALEIEEIHYKLDTKGMNYTCTCGDSPQSSVAKKLEQAFHQKCLIFEETSMVLINFQTFFGGWKDEDALLDKFLASWLCNATWYPD